MKVKIKNEPRAVVSALEMSEGQVGIVEPGDSYNSYTGEIVLRSYEALVSLSCPLHIWCPIRSGYPKFDIRLLSKGTILELEVEEGEKK